MRALHSGAIKQRAIGMRIMAYRRWR